MISRLFLLSAIAFSTVAAQADLIAKLIDAPTDIARIALLPDEAFKFDFVNNPNGRTVGSGGFSASANAVTMPATIGNDVSISTRIFLSCPCPTDARPSHVSQLSVSLDRAA